LGAIAELAIPIAAPAFKPTVNDGARVIRTRGNSRDATFKSRHLDGYKAVGGGPIAKFTSTVFAPTLNATVNQGARMPAASDNRRNATR
jgi:hypothetical protein